MQRLPKPSQMWASFRLKLNLPGRGREQLVTIQSAPHGQVGGHLQRFSPRARVCPTHLAKACSGCISRGAATRWKGQRLVEPSDQQTWRARPACAPSRSHPRSSRSFPPPRSPSWVQSSFHLDPIHPPAPEELVEGRGDVPEGESPGPRHKGVPHQPNLPGPG